MEGEEGVVGEVEEACHVVEVEGDEGLPAIFGEELSKNKVKYTQLK